MATDTPRIVNVNCNHCGASLDIDEQTRFVTCSYCHSRLAVQHTGSATFTSVLDKIEQNTGQIADNLKVIELQNDLSQLDREWQNSRDELMVTGRRGSQNAPSTAGGLVSIFVGLIGGGVWTALAASIGAPSLVILFGIIFIVIGVAGGIVSLSKADQLETARAAYESRRQHLLSALETEKTRQ